MAFRGKIKTLVNAEVFDDVQTSFTSGEFGISADFSKLLLFVNIDSTLAPTDLLIELQFKDDDGVWHTYANGFWGDLRYEDLATASGLEECLTGDLAGGTMRLKLTATGTDATNLFTVTLKVLPYSE